MQVNAYLWMLCISLSLWISPGNWAVYKSFPCNVGFYVWVRQTFGFVVVIDGFVFPQERCCMKHPWQISCLDLINVFVVLIFRFDYSNKNGNEYVIIDKYDLSHPVENIFLPYQLFSLLRSEIKDPMCFDSRCYINKKNNIMAYSWSPIVIHVHLIFGFQHASGCIDSIIILANISSF